MIKDHKNGIIYRIDALRKKQKKYIYYENDKQKTYE